MNTAVVTVTLKNGSVDDQRNAIMGAIETLTDAVIENYSISINPDTEETFLLEERHKSYFSKLIESDFGEVKSARKQPALSGVYAFFDGPTALYVGRTNKRGLGPRMQNHLTKSHNQAVLAFKMARKEMGIATAYSGEATRKNLMTNPQFLATFLAKIEYVASLRVKFVEISESDEQYIFEYYASKRLKSPHNDFNTH